MPKKKKPKKKAKAIVSSEEALETTDRIFLIERNWKDGVLKKKKKKHLTDLRFTILTR